MAKVSVIIVSYRVKHYIEQCVDSVLRSVPDARIIVVDNNSGDASAQYIESRCPTVRVIANDCNMGFGKANNQALQEVDTQYVLFLNPDTVVAEDTIPACMEHMEQHPDTGAIGVRMQYGNGRFALESRRSVPTPAVSFCHMMGLGRLLPTSRTFARYHMTYMDTGVSCPIEVVSGAFMMARTQLVKQLGGFDSDFFMYGEDIDLSYRILKAGYSNCYLPVPIVHYKGESTVKTTYRYAKVFYDAMLIFYDKHFKDHYRLLAIMVRIAVKFRQMLAFVGQNLLAGRRRLAYVSEPCVFIGLRENYEKACLMAAGSRFVRDFTYMETGVGAGGTDVGLNGVKPEMLAGRRAVAFDVEAFSYREIMDFMYSLAQGGTYLTMWLYNARTGHLISEDEVL